MNIEKGKQIFFRYNGNHFYIDRELGNEYKKCEVPKEIEEKWTEEIIESLRKKIYETKGNDRIVLINSYIQLLNTNSAINFLIDFTSEVEMDTFSLIIIGETLKQYMYKNIDFVLIHKICNQLYLLKEKMLKNKINIDISFKQLSYLKNYDFSNTAIIQRINNLI